MINAAQLAGLAPELTLIAGAIILLLGARRLRRPEVPAGLAVSAAVAAALLAGCAGRGAADIAGMLARDGWARFFKFLFCLNLGLSALLSARSVADEKAPAAEYYALLMLATTGMMIAASSLDLVTLYLGLELMALSSYILVGILRDKPAANEAALKYFLLGSFASAILLYGASLAYGLTGATGLAAIAAAVTERGLSAHPLILAAVALLTAGLAFKIAVVPFHAWAPDAYEGASAPIAAFLAVGSKAAGFAVLGRVCLLAFPSEQTAWSAVLVPMSALSMMVGGLLAMAQTNVKRMLAYSSIAHAGYALLGVIPGTPADLTATAAYLAAYAFMTTGAFAVVIALGPRGEELDGFEGLGVQSPGLAAIMLLFLLSLTGIPPTAGFAAKFLVFKSALAAGYAPLALLGVACSVVSAFFYLRVAVLMYMTPPRGEAPARCPAPVAAALALAAAAVLIGGVFPELLTASSHAAGLR